MLLHVVSVSDHHHLFGFFFCLFARRLLRLPHFIFFFYLYYMQGDRIMLSFTRLSKDVHVWTRYAQEISEYFSDFQPFNSSDGWIPRTLSSRRRTSLQHHTADFFFTFFFSLFKILILICKLRISGNYVFFSSFFFIILFFSYFYTCMQRAEARELVREIAAVEVEIIHLERYILSLYRTNFAHHLAATAAVNIQQLRRTSDSNSDNPLPPSLNTASIGSTQEHRMLADHLCASIRDNVFGNPCKLSEDILKSIASVYCKLSSNTAPTVFSPVSSLSASTTFSLRDQSRKSDNCSPRYYYEPTTSPSQLVRLKAKDGVLDMVEITRIVIDKERFQLAVTMLEDHRFVKLCVHIPHGWCFKNVQINEKEIESLICRILVRRLESVDPSKMDHEEKLCFWINVHNSMVMHVC